MDRRHRPDALKAALKARTETPNDSGAQKTPPERDIGRDNGRKQPNRRFFSLYGATIPAQAPDPGLYVVATPIGNLGDVTLRALEILAGADAILAEDTRVTRGLLTHYGISAELIPAHDHNAAALAPRVLARLAAGEALALTSDAGTPLISDPGALLVEQARAAGHRVIAIPGACAVLTAIVASGIGAGAFFFEGFLPVKGPARRARLAELAQIPGALAFYESPRRLAETLQDCATALGARQGAVARELTKKFEEVRRGDLTELAAFYAQAEPRGEVVLLIDAPPAHANDIAEEEILARLAKALETYSIKDAAAIVAGETGQPRRKIYAQALRMTQRP